MDGVDEKQEIDERDLQERDVTVKIDDHPVTSPRKTTAGELLERDGLDPAQRQLVKVEGRDTKKYAPGDELTLHPGEEFITLAVGPTPLS
ncbi:MAG TPA: hypothetical protein VK662_00580 [Acidothermaceae bacterium]|jgi:hypothetical protein|nr:hypothetical protein [Acidothermaceae bacterium]